MKNFVKAMDHHEKGFQYLLENFGPKKSAVKLKAGVFVRPDIRDLIKDEKFNQHMNNLESSAWKLFKQVVHNFLGSKKSENYADVVQEMLIAYQKLGCHMSLKIHLLHLHLNFFLLDNLGDVSDEHGERFYQDIFDTETCYQGKPNNRMIYYKQRKTNVSYRCKARSQKHF